MNSLESKWLGKINYLSSIELQNHYLDNKQEVVIGMEYEPVITLGIRSNDKVDLMMSREEVNKLGYSVQNVRRGGEATLHNPGQLVIYPIVNFKSRELSVRDFICRSIKATQAVLQELGIESFEKKEPGLYTSNGKIAFFGFNMQKGWSSHGLSINVNNALEDFKCIKSCGVSSEKFDSVNKYQEINVQELFAAWVEKFNFRSDCAK